MDRISDLPDDILHHILSFLTIQEASGAILLSKRWNHAWATLHCLNFGETAYFGRDEMTQLESFVDRNLMNRREKGISIHRFQIGIWADQEFPVHADRWIGWLVECNIRELELKLGSTFYDLPRTVFAAKSLTVLSLRHCFMRLPCDADHVLFPSLQKLRLRYVVVDDQLIRNLANICSGLEDLKLVNCLGLRSIKIWGLPKLSKLHLELYYPTYFHELEFEVEVMGLNNLQSFVYNENHVRCQKFDIVSCTSLKSLSISYANISDRWFHDLFPKLHLLETLYLRDCFSLKKIHISSYTLRHLGISGCTKLTKASMDTPNLLSLRYEGRMVPVSLNASGSLRTDLYLTFINADKHAWGNGIITEFLSMFDRSEVVKIFTRCHEVSSFNFLISRKSLVPSLPKHFIHAIFPTDNCRLNIDLVDNLLWTWPHAETLCILSDQTHFYPELLFKELKARDLPMRWGPHWVKDVKFEKLDAAECKRRGGDYLPGFCLTLSL